MAVYAGSSHVIIADAWIDYIPSEETGLTERLTRRTWIRIMNRENFQNILNNLSNPAIQNELLDVYFCAPSIDNVAAHNPLLVFNLNNVDTYESNGNLYQRISKYAFMREPPKQKRNSTVKKGSYKDKSILRKSTYPYEQPSVKLKNSTDLLREEKMRIAEGEEEGKEEQKQLEWQRQQEQRQIEEQIQLEWQRQQEEWQRRQEQIQEEGEQIQEEGEQIQEEGDIFAWLEKQDFTEASIPVDDFGSGKKRRPTKKRKYKSKTRRRPRRRPYI